MSGPPPFGIYPDRFDDAPSRDGGRRTDVSVNLDAERVQVKVTDTVPGAVRRPAYSTTTSSDCGLQPHKGASETQTTFPCRRSMTYFNPTRVRLKRR